MYSNLSEEIVSKIKEEVEKIKEEYQIVNPIIRNDIFDILDDICVVLRYPLSDDEEANGIHVERWIKGEKRDFVFINTSNSIEKQIYTAAHELGHVWKIDEKVLAGIEKDVDAEAVINRFAAELLMPNEIFEKIFKQECAKNNVQGGRVEDKVFTMIIVSLMNTFMVPYKAIVYRIEEIGYIDTVNRKKLEKIERGNHGLIEECVKTGDYQNIYKIDKQKSMTELYESRKRWIRILF